jgi:hypothetical protein
VSPAAPLRYLEDLLSLDKENVLENNARAKVVPETAEDGGVSARETLDVNIDIESLSCFLFSSCSL